MKNEENANICYVFSQATLDLAITDWVDIKTKNVPENHEQYLIVAEALPWLLKHLNQNPSLFMFPHNDLINGLKTWRETQEAAYPHKKKLIKSTCEEMINFFQSETITNHKMRIEA